MKICNANGSTPFMYSAFAAKKEGRGTARASAVDDQGGEAPCGGGRPTATGSRRHSTGSPSACGETNRRISEKEHPRHEGLHPQHEIQAGWGHGPGRGSNGGPNPQQGQGGCRVQTRGRSQALLHPGRGRNPALPGAKCKPNFTAQSIL